MKMHQFSLVLLLSVLSVVTVQAAQEPITLFNVGQPTEQSMNQDIDALRWTFGLEKDADEVLEASRSATGHCQDINVTEAQKEKIETGIVTLIKANIQLKADLKIAGLDYMVSIFSKNGTKALAETASTAMGVSVQKMVLSHLNFANEVLFDILNTDQRKPAAMCMAHMRRMMEIHKLKEMCKKLEEKK